MTVRLTDLGITEDIKVNNVATDYATKLASILGNGAFNRTSSVVSSVYIEEVSSEIPEAVGEGEYKPLQAQSEYARHEVDLKKIAGRVAITEEADALLDGLGYTPSAEINRLYHKMVEGMLAHLSEKSESEGTLVPSVASFEDFARYASLVDADSLVISTREMKEMSLITDSAGGPMFPLNGVSVYGLNVTVLKSDERFAYFYKSSDSLFTLNADKIIRRNPYSRLSENVIEYIFECHYSYDFIRDTRVKRVTFGEEYETGDGGGDGEGSDSHTYPVLDPFVTIEGFNNGDAISVPFHFNNSDNVNPNDTYRINFESSTYSFYSHLKVGDSGNVLVNEISESNMIGGEGRFSFSLSDKSADKLLFIGEDVMDGDIVTIILECLDSSGSVIGGSESTVTVYKESENGGGDGEGGGEESGEFYLTAGDGGYFEVDEESSAGGIYTELTFEGDPSAWTSSDLYHIDFEVTGDAIVRGFVVDGEELPDGQYSADLNPLDQPQSPVSVMILLDEFSDGSSANVNIDVSTNGSYEFSSTCSINMVSTSGGGGTDMVYLLPTDIRYTDDPIQIDTANGNNEFTLELPFEGDITAGDPNGRLFTVTLESYDGNSQFTVLDSDGGYMDSPGGVYFTEVNPERSTNDPFILNVIVDSVNGGQDTLWVETISSSLEGGDEQRAQYYTLIDANGNGETENPDESEENVFAFDEEGTLDVAPESGVVRVDYNHLNPSATSDRTHILKVSTSDRIDMANMKEVLEDGTDWVWKQGVSETGEHLNNPEWGETYELELNHESKAFEFSTRERDPDANEKVELELITKDSSDNIVRTSTKTIQLRSRVLIGTKLANPPEHFFDYLRVSDDNVISMDFEWTGKVDEALNDESNSYIINVPVYPFSSVEENKPNEQEFRDGAVSFVYDGVSYPNEDSYSNEFNSHVIPVELSYDNAAGFTVDIEVPSYQENEGYGLRATLDSEIVDTIGLDLGLTVVPTDNRVFFLYREGDAPEGGYGTPFATYDEENSLRPVHYETIESIPFKSGDTYKIVSNDPVLSDPNLSFIYDIYSTRFALPYESGDGEWNKIATVPVEEYIGATGSGGQLAVKSNVPLPEGEHLFASCYFLNLDSTGRVVYKSYARLPIVYDQ